jgi:hypothetical protein
MKQTLLIGLSLFSTSALAAGPFSKVEVTGAEVYLDVAKTSGEKATIGTDGPTIEVQAQFAKDAMPVTLQNLGAISLAGTFDLNRMASIEDSKGKAPLLHGKVDWKNLFREAKVVLDVDPASGIPFATVIKTATLGIQDIGTGTFNTAMPNDDNSLIRGVTRVRSARAFRIDLNNENFQELAIAVFKTHAHHSENYGENVQKSSPGVSMTMTKVFADRFTVNGSFTRINFPEKAEVRINYGLAYENPEGGYKLYLDGAKLKNNPLYPDATAARTVGLIQSFNDGKLTATLEQTNINNGTRERAFGLMTQVSKHFVAGAGVRVDQTGKKSVELRVGAVK